jgi:hypothetical protein
VAAGLEVVEDFLRQGQVLCQALGRDGSLEVVTLPEAHPLTNKPLVRRACAPVGALQQSA